jgi:DNA-binding response OmpR family regulator
VTAGQSGYAIVIEPHHPLAQTLAECLRQRGFAVGITGTHIGGAAMALSHGRVDFLAAAVPAPGEDLAGAYLADARVANPCMAVIIMLSDPKEDISHAPTRAVKIVKPFNLLELAAAVGLALAWVASLRPLT